MVLRRLDEILSEYDIDTFVIGMPYNMNGTKTDRAEITEKFIHKLKCKYNKIKIETIDERLTTVAAHKTMNFLDVNKKKKRDIVDTISAVYILEMYINKNKG
ncbi:MAG: Holliday junction resolvase RuvX [Clostridia bacterium]